MTASSGVERLECCERLAMLRTDVTEIVCDTQAL